MEWLLQHEGDPDVPEPLPSSKTRPGRTIRKRKEFVPNPRVRIACQLQLYWVKQSIEVKVIFAVVK